MKQGHFVRLRQERELRGWSRTYIAEQLEVDPGTVGRWERGERLPHPHYRQKLCILFEKSAWDLGLLSAPLDEPDERKAFLDSRTQVFSTREQGITPSLATTPSASTPPSIDILQSETPSVASEALKNKAFALMTQQNRQQMLKKMHFFWISGVLEQSLHDAKLIDLNFVKQYNAVTDPWILATQQPEEEPGTPVADRSYPLTSGIPIDQIYDEASGELLILGEPGSGKTTLLLELARILLERASQKEIHPIPVVFNLASWTIKRQPFEEWLMEELYTKYFIPRKLAQTWIQAEQILPLLDGLDEVEAVERGSCIRAINAYRREHGLLSMVVCCRQADYFAQDARLLLHSGAIIQPLTARQVDAYLAAGGEQLATLRRSLQIDSTLQELTRSPLMLNILALTYQDKAIDMSAEPFSLDVRRREVFTTYINQMLARRKSQSRYTTEQTLYWLTWLARRLTQRQQTEFYIERMQPDWLSSPRALRWYCRLLVGLLVGVLGGLTATLADVPLFEFVHKQLYIFLAHTSITAAQCADTLPAFGTLAGTIASVSSLPIVGLCYGIGFALFGGLLGGRETRPRSASGSTRLSKLYRCSIALVLGLSCGSVFVLINLLWVSCPISPGLYNQVAEELSYGLAGVFVCGLLGVLTRDLFGARKMWIQPVEALIWTRVPTRQRVLSLVLGGAFGILVGGGTELACEVYLKFASWQSYLLISMLIGGLLGLIGGGGVGGFSRRTLKESSLIKPNEGIRRSMHNSLIIGLPIGLALSSFTLGLVWWLIPAHVSDGLLWSVPLGVIVTVILILLNGGYACLQHIILRFILCYQGHIPWDYVHFLDEAADRLLLRKVGGGYIFIHRLLLDHFASM